MKFVIQLSKNEYLTLYGVINNQNIAASLECCNLILCSLAEWWACLAPIHELVGSIPRTATLEMF